MTASGSASLLHLDGVSRHFGARHLDGTPRRIEAVVNVDLAMDVGECLGLVGGSGCGKTTLARLITRLIEPTAGTIRFRGEDWGQLAPSRVRERRRHLQLVFQSPQGSLHPRRRVRNIVAEPLEVHGAARRDAERRAGEWIERVELPREVGDRFPHELSGGQAQRVALARALVLEPELLVVDEPTASLDGSVRSRIVDLLAGLRREWGGALLVISHDLDVVRALAPKVAVMSRGQIVEIGPVGRVLGASPSHPYTAELVAAAGDGGLAGSSIPGAG